MPSVASEGVSVGMEINVCRRGKDDNGYRRPDFLFRLILPVGFVPRFPLLREHHLVRAHEPREHSAARRLACTRRPLRGSDRDDKAYRNVKRRPELGPVRTNVSNFAQSHHAAVGTLPN